MRVVTLGEPLMSEALSYLGIHRIDYGDDMLASLRGLLKDRNNVILIGASLANEYSKQIKALQKEFKDSMIIVIPDSRSEIKLDSQSLIAETLGIKI